MNSFSFINNFGCYPWHTSLIQTNSTVWHLNIQDKYFIKVSPLDLQHMNTNKGNAKRGVSPRLKIWPSDFDLWPWKSIGFLILLRTKYVPSLVKIHWRMLIPECSQGCYVVKIWPVDLDLWPWKSLGFRILLRTKYVPSLVKIHWRMLILECSQGCDGQTDGSVTISLRNFVGEGITSRGYLNLLYLNSQTIYLILL